MTPTPQFAKYREQLAAWSMVAPALLITVTFALYPVFDSFWLSLHHIFTGIPQLGSQFVGTDNYQALLQDPVARQALLVTLGFVLVSTLLELVCGLMIALVIHERFRGRGLVRAAILIPWAIPTVVASQLWRYIFNDRYGLANLLWFGDRVTDYVPWLAYPSIAFGIVVLADVWKTASFAALLTGAAVFGKIRPQFTVVGALVSLLSLLLASEYMHSEKLKKELYRHAS